MKILATIALGIIVAVAGLLSLLFSICAVSGGWSINGRAGLALTSLIFLGIAVGGVMLIAKLNRKSE
ncbi:MAG: hypothetical protein ABSB14_06785 [Candidatus Sulfotelmatobacter sp.]